VTFPSELPITGRVIDIVNAIDANPVVIVAGETGSTACGSRCEPMTKSIRIDAEADHERARALRGGGEGARGAAGCAAATAGTVGGGERGRGTRVRGARARGERRPEMVRGS
jgi:hypothetical protein